MSKTQSFLELLLANADKGTYVTLSVSPRTGYLVISDNKQTCLVTENSYTAIRHLTGLSRAGIEATHKTLPIFDLGGFTYGPIVLTKPSEEDFGKEMVEALSSKIKRNKEAITQHEWDHILSLLDSSISK